METLIVIAIFIGYTVIEYRRREERHREEMEYLRQGKDPPIEQKKPEVWRLYTTGGVGVLLVGMVGGFVWLASQAGRYWISYLIAGSVFVLLLVLVALMFAKDLQAYRQSGRT